MRCFKVEKPNSSLLIGIVSIGREAFSCVNTGLEWPIDRSYYGLILQAHARCSSENSQLSESRLLPQCRMPGLWYLLLWIPFVLIITINDWFGYLNASFRETSLLCHCYKLLPKLCFTQGGFIHSFIFFCPRDVVTILQAIGWEGNCYQGEMSTRTARERVVDCCEGFFSPF